MKPVGKSKTVWTGVLVTVLSIAAVVVEAWNLLTPEQVSLLEEFFGPEVTAFIGIVMVALRAVTTSAVGFRGK